MIGKRNKIKCKPKEIDSWNIHIFRGKKEEIIVDLPDDIAESIDTWLGKYGPDYEDNE